MRIIDLDNPSRQQAVSECPMDWPAKSLANPREINRQRLDISGRKAADCDHRQPGGVGQVRTSSTTLAFPADGCQLEACVFRGGQIDG